MITGTAPCGMKYAVRKGGNAVAFCSLSIRVGTRDEEGFPCGIAHFTEHTIFKGTTHRSSSVINSYLDRLGGELNAFTTKEEIVLHATVLKDDLRKAGGLLLDLASCPTFPENAVETERGVVIDEILSYKDSPAEDVYDTFEEKLFRGHPLSSPILGTEESVSGITGSDLRRFHDTMFTPDVMAFSIVAPIEEDKLSDIAEAIIAKYYGTTPPSVIRTETRTLLAPSINPFNERVDKGNHEVNAVIGAQAPSMYEDRHRYPTVLLMNLLAGPASNSLLNNVLRERNGWVYAVEGSYTRYADSGVASISLGCDRSNIGKCLRAVNREITKLQNDLLSPSRLSQAKKQLLGQHAISSESGEVQCLSMGKNLLAYGRIAPDSEIFPRVEAITAEDLRSAACQLFGEGRLCTLVFL